MLWQYGGPSKISKWTALFTKYISRTGSPDTAFLGSWNITQVAVKLYLHSLGILWSFCFPTLCFLFLILCQVCLGFWLAHNQVIDIGGSNGCNLVLWSDHLVICLEEMESSLAQVKDDWTFVCCFSFVCCFPICEIKSEQYFCAQWKSKSFEIWNSEIFVF